MGRVQCFLVEPTLQTEVYLRRYAKGECPGNQGRYSYHDARVRVADAALEPRDSYPGVLFLVKPETDWCDDPRWPTKCDHCPYIFAPEDCKQVFTDHIWKRVGSDETWPMKSLPPGAMWDAKWWTGAPSPDGLHLMVRLPNGTDWMIDGPASNCREHEIVHNCWVREGVPPEITIVPGANICKVGGGSIQSGNYHGFLRQGWLED